MKTLPPNFLETEGQILKSGEPADGRNPQLLETQNSSRNPVQAKSGILEMVDTVEQEEGGPAKRNDLRQGYGWMGENLRPLKRNALEPK